MPDLGYNIQTERIQVNPGDNWVTIESAYTPKGLYIGNPKEAYFLCKRLGIKPEVYEDDKVTCTIGFCKKENKWYGWSHRAIYGFGIGDIVSKGDATAGQDPKSLPIGFKATTLEHAKQMAIAFADSVS